MALTGMGYRGLYIEQVPGQFEQWITRVQQQLKKLKRKQDALIELNFAEQVEQFTANYMDL
eukprot:7142099-Heterocapsa_arctica.AAC.1